MQMIFTVASLPFAEEYGLVILNGDGVTISVAEFAFSEGYVDLLRDGFVIDGFGRIDPGEVDVGGVPSTRGQEEIIVVVSVGQVALKSGEESLVAS